MISLTERDGEAMIPECSGVIFAASRAFKRDRHGMPNRGFTGYHAGGRGERKSKNAGDEVGVAQKRVRGAGEVEHKQLSSICPEVGRSKTLAVR